MRLHQGGKAKGSCFPRVHAKSFEVATKKLFQGRDAEALPRRGDPFPAHWKSVALPSPGTVPVSIQDVSPRAAEYLDNMATAMIDPNRDQKMIDSGIAPYTDPHFCDKENLLALAGRMAAGGMLRAVPEVRGTMPIFTVTKSAEFIESDVKISLRLIFDLRLENEGWRDAPWCGLGGVSCLSFLDVSEKLRQGSSLLYAVGDVPDYFYMLEIPEVMSQHFALDGLDADDLRRVLGPDVVLPGTGQAVGSRVLPMGFKWSVFLAQTVLEDIFEHGGSDVPELGVDRRVMEGAPMPQITRAAPTAYYTYIDDFGIFGIGDDPDAADHPVQRARYSARKLLRTTGFAVHKEGCSTAERMIGGDFVGHEPVPKESRQVVGRDRSRVGHLQATALHTGHHRVPARSVHLVLSHLEACTFGVQHHLRLVPAHAWVRSQHRGTDRGAEGAGLCSGHWTPSPCGLGRSLASRSLHVRCLSFSRWSRCYDGDCGRTEVRGSVGHTRRVVRLDRRRICRARDRGRQARAGRQGSSSRRWSYVGRHIPMARAFPMALAARGTHQCAGDAN